MAETNIGSLVFDIGANTGPLKKSLSGVKGLLDLLAKSIATKLNKKGFLKLNEGAQELTKNLDGACAKVSELERQLNEATKNRLGDENVASLKEQLGEATKNARDLFSEFLKTKTFGKDGLFSKVDLSEIAEKGGPYGKLASALMKAGKAGKLAFGAIKIGAKAAGTAVGALVTADLLVLSKTFDAMKRIGAMAFKALAAAAIAAGAAMISLGKQGFERLLQYDTATATSVANLKGALAGLGNALAAAFAPIFNTVAPALITLINLLTNAANAVAHFMAALTGKKTALIATKQTSGIGKSIGGVGKKAGGAAKKVKDLQRTLMGFDKINKLDKKSDDGGGGSGGGGGGGGAGAGIGGMFDTVPISKQASDLVGKLKDSWKKADFTWLGALLASKINSAMARIPWGKINSTAKRIAKSIGTFLNGFVETLDWGLLGRTLSNGILVALNFLSTFLETVHWQSFGKAIVDFITGIKWGALFKAASRLVGNIAGALAGVIWGAVKQAAKKAKKYFQSLGGDGIGGFLLGVVKAIARIPRWIVNHIFKPFINGFKKAFGISSPSKKMKEQGGYIIDGLLEGIKNKLSSITDWFKGLPDKIKDAIGDVGDFFGEIFDGISDKTVEFKAVVATKWSDIKTNWESLTINIKDKTADMKAKVASVWSDLKTAWGNLVDNVKEKTADMKARVATTWNDIKTAWNNAVDNVKSKVVGMYAAVKTKWNDLKNAWTNATQNIKSKTVGMYAAVKTKWNDIKTAWNNLTKNIKDKTVSLKVKLTAAASNAYNAGVKKLRSSKIKAVSAFGYKLPYPLAQGGWVGKNSPRLAIVGDNRHEGEIVSPESKLEAMARQAARESSGVGNERIAQLLVQLINVVQSKDNNVYLDGEEIKNNTVRRINQHTRATGRLEISVI